MRFHALFVVAFCCPSVLTTRVRRQQQQPSVGNIEEVAARNGFSSVLDFVVKAGLGRTLSNGGPFTMFTPTNDAFAALDPVMMQALDTNPDLLKNIFFYHVVPGKIYARDLINDAVVPSAQGTSLRVNLYPRTATVNGVRIVATDLEATNGVIHVIDKVLIPPAGDVVDVLVRDPRFSTLVTVVQAAGFVNTLKSQGPFTVFAPTNDAFNRLPQGALQGLLQNPKALAEVLTRHIVPQTIYSAAIPRSFEPRTVSNDRLRIDTAQSGPAIRIRSPYGASSIIQTDIAATNGVIHVLDTVI